MERACLIQKSWWHVTLFLGVLGSVVAMAGNVLAPADDFLQEDLDYVQALQEQGFADLAVDYLQMLETRPGLSAEAKGRLAYQFGKALVAQADEADAETEAKLLEQAVERFNQFLATDPKDEDAIDARNETAGILMRRGVRMLARADADKVAAELATKLRDDARKLFEKARTGLGQAAKDYAAALKDLKSEQPDEKKKTKRRRRATAEERQVRMESALVMTQINLAMTEYHLARAMGPDPKVADKRKEALAKAAGMFDAIYQRYRDSGSVASIYSHLWHGRSAHEAGNYVDAIDIYDEVVVNEVSARGQRRSRELDNLFAQANLFRYQALIASGKANAVSNGEGSATQWLKDHAAQARTVFGLGIQLELARSKALEAEKLEADSAKRREAFSEVMRLIAGDLTKVASPYRAEAFRVREKYAKEVRRADGKMNSYGEAIFFANALLAEEKWSEAAAAYDQALALVEKKTDPDEVLDTRFRQAFAFFRAGNAAKAIDISEKLTREQPNSKRGPDAADIALSAYYTQAASAKTPADRQKAFDGLLKLSAHVEKQYPKLRVADKSYQLAGVVQNALQNYSAAATNFLKVSPDAPAYAESRLQAGRAIWADYQVKAKDERTKGDEKQFAALAQNAMNAFAVAFRIEWNVLNPKGPAKSTKLEPIVVAPTEAELSKLSPILVDSSLQLATVCLRLSQFDKARDWIDPTLAAIAKSKQPDMERFRMPVLIAAMEVAIGRQDLERGNKLVAELIASSKDNSRRVSEVLLRLGKSLQDQIAQLTAEGKTERAAGTRKAFENFLGQIADRSKEDYTTLSYLADSYIGLGDFAKAQVFYDEMLSLLEKKPDLFPAEQRVIEKTRLKLARAVALRQAGGHADALKLVDELLAEHNASGKNTYPLQMALERGRILNAWQKTDASKASVAFQHWNTVARQLQKAARKSVEFFEARLATAESLVRMGRKADGVQIVRSTLALNANLGSDEMKQKYQAFLDQHK